MQFRLNYLIYKSFLRERCLINYIFICFFLFILFFSVISFKNFIVKDMYSYKNKEEMRTIEVDLYDEYSFDELEGEECVEDVTYDELTHNYKVLIKEYDYIDKFIGLNENKISFYSVQSDGEWSSLEKINQFNLVLCIIIIFITIALLIINVLLLVFSEKKNLALYKLIGYKDLYLVFRFVIFLLIIHTIIFLLSILFNKILIIFINGILSFMGNVMVLEVVPMRMIVISLSVMYIVILFINIFLYFVFKKISPIVLFKSSD